MNSLKKIMINNNLFNKSILKRNINLRVHYNTPILIKKKIIKYILIIIKNSSCNILYNGIIFNFCPILEDIKEPYDINHPYNNILNFKF